MRERGFSILEALVVVGVFTVITGAVFGLLDASQQRYKMEAEFLDTFQGARLALEQIARDVHTAGYPPGNAFAPGFNAGNRVALPFGWSPGYPAAPCLVGACAAPSGFDLVIETDMDPRNNNGVEWVRYRLNGMTLERGVASKVVGADPLATTAGAMVPYVENVVNNANGALRGAIQASYPGMFANGPVPVFTYQFEAGQPNQPSNIREVNITLLVMAPNADPRTGQLRVVTLTGRARRINPNQ